MTGLESSFFLGKGEQVQNHRFLFHLCVETRHLGDLRRMRLRHQAEVLGRERIGEGEVAREKLIELCACSFPVNTIWNCSDDWIFS
jgi:hypothetical protein